VQLTAQEKAELARAAAQAGVAVSVFVRMIALAAVRRNDGVVRIETAAA
jgi:cell division inhibitor SulA